VPREPDQDALRAMVSARQLARGRRRGSSACCSTGLRCFCRVPDLSSFCCLRAPRTLFGAARVRRMYRWDLDAFSSTAARISMPTIERAPGRQAACIGSDRAYLWLTARPTRVLPGVQKRDGAVRRLGGSAQGGGGGGALAAQFNPVRSMEYSPSFARVNRLPMGNRKLPRSVSGGMGVLRPMSARDVNVSTWVSTSVGPALPH